MKYLIIISMFMLVCTSSLAETTLIPFAGYGYMDVEQQQESAFAGGFIIESGEAEPANIGDIDYLLASLHYANYSYTKKLDFAQPDEFHSINAMVNYKKRAHELLAIVTSDSADPFENKYTFQAGAVYGYRFAHSERFSLVLGGGIVGGVSVDIIPAPYIAIKYDTDVLSAKFDMITDPSLEIVLMPKSMFSLLLDAHTSNFDEVEYLMFTAALQYRPFQNDLEFIKFSAGIKSDGHEFNSTEKDTAFFMHAYSAFVGADFGFIKLSGGHVFESKEIYTNNDVVSKKDTGTGYYVSIEAKYAF